MGHKSTNVTCSDCVAKNHYKLTYLDASQPIGDTNENNADFIQDINTFKSELPYIYVPKVNLTQCWGTKLRLRRPSVYVSSYSTDLIGWFVQLITTAISLNRLPRSGGEENVREERWALVSCYLCLIMTELKTTNLGVYYKRFLEPGCYWPWRSAFFRKYGENTWPKE